MTRSSRAASKAPMSSCSIPPAGMDGFEVLLARGMTNREFAEHLTLGEATVKAQVSSVFSKLGIRDRAQAVIVAARPGSCGRPGAAADQEARHRTR